MVVAVKVLFFASAREAAGTAKRELILEDNACRASDALRALQSEYPGLDLIKSQISVAVNKNYLGDDDVEMRAGDELALLPPIAGG